MRNLLGLRKEVFEVEKYIPGKTMDEVKAAYGIDKVIKLGSNENPYGPFENTIEKMKEELKKMNIYPEANFVKLKQILGEKFGLTEDNITLAHGAGGAIETLAKVFISKGDEFIISKQSYGLYKEVSKIMGGITKVIPLNKDYTVDIDALISIISNKTKMIWLCNPNNPTGTMIDKKDIDRILEVLPETGWLILDEAYIEFSDVNKIPNGTEYIKDGKNVVVVRTFSKFYGLAGARIGYIVANTGLITGFDTVAEPFNASRIALCSAISVLTDDYEEVCKFGDKIKFERGRVSKELEKLGLEPVKSETNFIFFSTPFNANEMGEYMIRKGVVIRPCGGWGYKNHIRVTVGTAEEMDIFLEVLKEALEEFKSKKV
jgi:histidinol-phosphate aminotransferase